MIKYATNKFLAILKGLALSMPIKLLLLGTLLAFTLYNYTTNSTNDLTLSSVMVTNIGGRSGGTGIVIKSSDTLSEVLTNSHVCHVVEKGGLVTGVAGSFLVSTYRHSKSHDLCLITVEGNLKANTKVADNAPTAFYETAFISGHPALMPNVIGKGHFSGRKVIPVMKGIKPCTDEQQTNPNTMILCLLAGGIPEVVQYDSTLVTATIMPGSSGSGVYNANKELAGVVFAGAGDFGYAWTVPFESMKNFLSTEVKTLEPMRPDNSLDLGSIMGNSKNLTESEMMDKLKDACTGKDREKIKETCKLLDQDMILRK